MYVVVWHKTFKEIIDRFLGKLEKTIENNI